MNYKEAILYARRTSVPCIVLCDGGDYSVKRLPDTAEFIVTQSKTPIPLTEGATSKLATLMSALFSGKSIRVAGKGIKRRGHG